jgi:hypothetical protein
MGFENNFGNLGKKIKEGIKKSAKGVLLVGGIGATTAATAQDMNMNNPGVKGNQEKMEAAIKTFNEVAVPFPEKEKETFVIQKDEEEPIKRDSAVFMDKLKKLKLIDKSMTKDEFAELALSEEKMGPIIEQYMKATGSVSPDKRPKDGTTISVTKNFVYDPHTIEVEGAKKEQKVFNFSEWFADQMAAVRQGKLKEGDSVKAPDGKEYVIREAKGQEKSSKLRYTRSPEVDAELAEQLGSKDTDSERGGKTSQTKYELVSMEDYTKGI